MARVYGVCNHSPDQVKDWLLKEHNVKNSKISVLPLNKKLPASIDKSRIRPYVFVLAAGDLHRNINVINRSLQDKVFFVFTSPISCHRYTNIPLIDAEVMKNTSLFGMNLTNLRKGVDISKTRDDIEHSQQEDYLTAVIESTKNFGSILNALMTFIYLLPSSTHQRPVKNAVCNWIYTSGDTEDLDYILDKVNKYATLSDKARTKLRKILLTDIGLSYREAFALYRESKSQDKPSSIPKLADAHNISAYDMRYIKSIVDTQERYSDLDRVTIQEFLRRMEKKNKKVVGTGSSKKKRKEDKAKHMKDSHYSVMQGKRVTSK